MIVSLSRLLCCKVKGELNVKTTTYFCLNLLLLYINSVKFILKLKSNYIEKLNVETKKTLQKYTVVANYEIVSGMIRRRLRYLELKYGIVLRNLDSFWAIYVS